MKEEKKKIYHKAKTSKRNPIFKLLNLKWMFIRSAFFVVLFNVLNKVIITMPNRKMKPFKWKLLNSTSCGAVYYVYKVALTFELEDEILKCDHSNESYWALLSRGSAYYGGQGDSNFWIDREMNLQADHSNESY